MAFDLINQDDTFLGIHINNLAVAVYQLHKKESIQISRDELNKKNLRSFESILNEPKIDFKDKQKLIKQIREKNPLKLLLLSANSFTKFKFNFLDFEQTAELINKIDDNDTEIVSYFVENYWIVQPLLNFAEICIRSSNNDLQQIGRIFIELVDAIQDSIRQINPSLVIAENMKRVLLGSVLIDEGEINHGLKILKEVENCNTINRDDYLLEISLKIRLKLSKDENEKTKILSQLNSIKEEYDIHPWMKDIGGIILEDFIPLNSLTNYS